jgi:LAO/AO transport system kinase
MWHQLLHQLQHGNIKALARTISLVENQSAGYEELLMNLPAGVTGIVGITGPPGAGKSTLADALIGLLVNAGKKVAVLCVDPSSPFNLGALLGDRIRMSEWYSHPNVFIRSLATRGSLGGLHPKIIEITDVVKAAQFDYIIIETVGVGQSEVEIAGLADVTIVTVVPEAGDEIQTMKAGLMEIADVFVVNKSDRPDADMYVRNLRLMLAPTFHTHTTPVEIIKTVASQKQGIEELWQAIDKCLKAISGSSERKSWLLAEKAYHLIRERRMKDISKTDLKDRIAKLLPGGDFNLYRLINNY